MTIVRRLQLVPYQEDDYSLGATLALEDATHLTDPKTIGAALSLYFQWEANRRCSISITDESGRPSGLECTIDYDRDERSPSELKVVLSDVQSGVGGSPFSGSHVRVRFEVFRTCYEFIAEILARSEEPIADGWALILAVPQEVRVRSTRRLPRVIVDEKEREIIGPVSWTASDGSCFDLTIDGLGLSSLRVKRNHSISIRSTGLIRLGALTLEAEAIVSSNEAGVFLLKFSNESDFGSYFDIYRKIAYPALRSRHDYDYEAGLALYSKSNYFGKYEGEKSDLQKSNIMETWAAIKSGFHITNADYYIVDDRNEPTGCSGLALTNFIGSDPVWTFHQLCALKRPDLIEQSGVLYMWRAEYLAARPGALLAYGCFHSKSRWLERIYVKHAMSNENSTQLSATINRRVEFKMAAERTTELKQFSIGDTKRTATTGSDFWGGVGPRYLNANENLDTIIVASASVTVNSLQRLGSDLCSFSDPSSRSILLTLPFDYPMIEEIGGEPQLSDRLISIPKSDMISLLSAVEHSVAVTEKKIKNGIIE